MERKGGRIERVKGYKSRDDGVEGTKVFKAKNTSIFSHVFRVLPLWRSADLTGHFRTLVESDISYLTFVSQRVQNIRNMSENCTSLVSGKIHNVEHQIFVFEVTAIFICDIS